MSLLPRTVCILVLLSTACVGDRSLMLAASAQEPASYPTGLIPTPSQPSNCAGENSVLKGIVKDASGAVVPNFHLTLRGSSFLRQTNTEKDGSFLFEGLTPCTYSVTGTKDGFSKTLVRDLQINPDALVSVQFKISPALPGSALQWFPENKGFPENPPLASSWKVLPRLVTSSGAPPRTLGEYDAILSAALDQYHYTRGYYSYPDGFVIATKLEQFAADGSTLPEPKRYERLPDLSPGFINYLMNLGSPRDGYFRIIVFIVTDRSILQSSETVSADTADSWPDEGVSKLPVGAAQQVALQGTDVTAYVYEFESSSARDSGKLQPRNSKSGIPPSRDAHSHLQAAGLWSGLKLQ